MSGYHHIRLAPGHRDHRDEAVNVGPEVELDDVAVGEAGVACLDTNTLKGGMLQRIELA